MKQKTLEFLTNNQSETPSMWREEAQWRRDNWSWLRHSQKIAVRVLLQMKQLGLIQKALAERMNCTQQYISKILKGKENMSLDTLSKLERALGITLILDEEYDNLPIGMVAEDAPSFPVKLSLHASPLRTYLGGVLISTLCEYGGTSPLHRTQRESYGCPA